MTRILAGLFSLLLLGTAAAQPPVDYTLMCDEEIIGTASYVDGKLHVAVVAGKTCEGELHVAEDADLVLVFDIDEDGVLTVTIGAMEGVAIELPQQAIDGKVGAARNRIAATERRGHGQETAAAKRGEHQRERPERPELPELPEVPELPVEIDPPIAPIDVESFGRPELPVEPAIPGGRRR